MSGIEVSREQLIGCWKILAPGGQYIELREDGTARKKHSWKGSSADLECQIRWRHIEPDGLEISYFGVGESEAFTVQEFSAKFFRGGALEWWRVRMNDHVVEDVMLTEPVCWKRALPPRSWQTRD